MDTGAIIAAVITVLIIIGAAAYIIKSKRSGKKCIGCPHSSACDSSACDSFACNSFACNSSSCDISACRGRCSCEVKGNSSERISENLKQ